MYQFNLDNVFNIYINHEILKNKAFKKYNTRALLKLV